MEKRKIIGTTLILIGFLFILNSFPGITGFAVAESVGNGVSGILGLVFVVGGVLVFNLENQLKKIENVRFKRELVSDAHRARNLARRGIDPNALWDKNKSYSENKEIFLDKFYDNVDNEINEGYMNYKKIPEKDFYDFYVGLVDRTPLDFKEYRKIREEISAKAMEIVAQNKDKARQMIELDIPIRIVKDKYKKSSEFKTFKKEALKYIQRFNRIISLKNENAFIPLYTYISEKEPFDYPGEKIRYVYYGPSNLNDIISEKNNKDITKRSNSVRTYLDKKRKGGEVILSHEIINPDVAIDPEELTESPHIHWELRDILKPNYFNKYISLTESPII